MSNRGNPPAVLGGIWSLPMSMAEIANRLGNMCPDAARRLLVASGLIRISRKRWRVRLDTLDLTLRHRIETGRPLP